MLSALTVFLAIPLLATALPLHDDAAYGVEVETGSMPIFGGLARCPIESATLDFPGFDANGQVPHHITLGVGVQNYTCTDDGTYKYAPRLQRKKVLSLIQV